MKKFAAVLLSAVIICYVGCYVTLLNIPVTPVYNEVAVKDTYYIKKEALLLSFINEHLTGEDGQILCSLKGTKGSDDILSESLGLMMNYGLIKDRKDLFDKQLLFLRDHMLVDGQYIKWKKGDKIYCNAAIDDFRIARALLEAGERWNNSEYFNIAGFIQEGIYNNQLRGGNLCELFDFKNAATMKNIPLCYLDFYTMHRLEVFNKNWQKVWNKGLTIVKNGRISEHSPFFNDCFSYENRLYYMDDRYGNKKDACLIYTLYTAIHLLEVNEDTRYLTEWLKKEIKKGKLYACYNPVTLEPAGDKESTAVYALAAVYCKMAGESKLFEVFVDRMLKFMVGSKESPYYGGFGNEETGEFYSFDNLTALWALALF